MQPRAIKLSGSMRPAAVPRKTTRSSSILLKLPMQSSESKMSTSSENETPHGASTRSTDRPEQETKRSGEHKKASHKAAQHSSTVANKSGSTKKAKPSFEIPSDAGAAESAAGWVFRETEAAVELSNSETP